MTGEEGVDTYWRATFGEFIHGRNILEEFEREPNTIQELINQTRSCLAIESPDPGTLKELCYYLDFACQIALAKITMVMQGEDVCRRVIKFMIECHGLFNAALAKPLSEFHRLKIGHYAENASMRISNTHDLLRQRAERW